MYDRSKMSEGKGKGEELGSRSEGPNSDFSVVRSTDDLLISEKGRGTTSDSAQVSIDEEAKGRE
jgi:hypothetical protein